MIHELHDLLYRAGARLRSLRLWSSLALCWVFWASVVYLVARFAAPTNENWLAMWGVLGGATLLTALVCWQLARRAGSDPRAIARRIEAKHPELGAMLLAALEEAPSPRFKRLSYLQATVVRGAVNHGRQYNWADHTSRGRLLLAKTAHLAALAALASAALLLVNRTKAMGRSSAGVGNDEAILSGAPFELTVEPGNAEVERGTTLLVIAKFKGPLPADADLLVDWEPAKPPATEASSAAESKDAASKSASASDSERTRRMTRSLDDPQFVGRVPAVSRGLTYSVAFAGQRSPTYRVTVFEYPELQRADAHLAYPAFTRMEPKTIEDIRQVTAVEGTTLTLRMRLNKDVAVARLVDREGVELALHRAEGEEPIYEATYVLAQSQRFKLHLIDHQQRQNKLPPEIAVNVTPNKPPTIKFTKPGRDVRVSPIEELEIAAELNDDFGVTAYGLAYSFGGDEPTDMVLTPAGDAAAAVEKKIGLGHLLDFESLAAEPDQLLSYYVWVEDLGVDGQPRRTLSDMYFAEVRPFDEIFREGEQPTEQQQREQQQQQQQGGAGQQAQELAELQKQIAAATWKLIRRETAETPSFEFPQDAGVLRDSQQQAIEMLGELGGEVRDEESLEHIAQTQAAMEEALEALERAADDEDLTALRPALSAEQRAYQALLKLRARESNVTQQQSGQSGTSSGAGSASQQQLQQLELSADENRYETQSRAASAAQENAQQLDESRQILNRLAELARRQQDLNERLRELQAALEEAQTPEEREELERQLKRLRDQQREILRDAEELDNDVQNSQNREQMQAEAEQLQETRSRVQQATEALEEGMVSQAVTEGARAERELSELRDDFRRRTADRFSEEMRELRDAAQQLDDRQQQLEEQLREMNSGGQRSLRDTGPRQEFLDGMELQRQELADALERMRETVTEAEEPEPLLANQLYEAVQDATEAQIEQALDMARQIAEAGATSEAAEPLRQATGGVRQLREQIDAAAESVLGDETEALRRADERLRELEEALNSEIENAQGGESGEEEGQMPGGDDRNQSPRGAEQGEGEQSGDGENGEPTEQEGEPGEGGQGGEPSADDTQQQEGAGQGQRQGRGGGQPGSENGEPQESDAGEQSQDGESQQGSQGGGNGEASENESNSGQGGAGGRRQGESADEDQRSEDAEGEPTESESPQTGDSNGGGGRNAPGGRRDRLNDLGNLFGGGGPGGPEDRRGPITGEDFRQWSEGMREVEDMLDDPDLAAEAARIRDRAEQARVDYVRHSKTPDWSKMVEMVAEPLAELRAEVAEEIRRKESPDSLVPIDRDTAPDDFAEAVRRYYQRLGTGE
jgi:hypothetical protein